MPTYDYTCAACRHKFERFESINDDAQKECPKCGKKKARRMLGMGAGLIFKGSGFYTTDSKNTPSPPPSGDSGDSKSGSEDSGSAAGDSGESKKDESKGKKKEKKEKKEKEPKK